VVILVNILRLLLWWHFVMGPGRKVIMLNRIVVGMLNRLRWCLRAHWLWVMLIVFHGRSSLQQYH
jgi:hypothetical protein